MSAPGADPLAAIRQERYARIEAARERVRIATGIDDWDDRSTLAIDGLIAQWDTRESALRALVADMQDRIEYMHRDTDWYRAQELDYWKRKVERLLSGPQPTGDRR